MAETGWVPADWDQPEVALDLDCAYVIEITERTDSWR